MAKRWYYKDENGNKVPVPQYKINSDNHYTKSDADNKFATKENADTKVAKTDIVQSVGNATDKIMSQKAVSDAIVELLKEYIFIQKEHYKYTDWNGNRLNIDRLYILYDYRPKIGIKTLTLNRVTNNIQHLYLMDIQDDSFVIIKEYTSKPINGVATFENIITEGKYLIGLQTDTGIFSPNVNHAITYYSGWSSDLSISAFNIVENNALDIEIVEFSTSKSYVLIDNFEGTDSEKLQQALDSCNLGGTIIIDRNITMTSNVVVNHVYSANHLIYIIGINAPIINMGLYHFKGAAENTGGIKFEGIKFVGDTNSGRILNMGGVGTLVNICFDKCVISNIAYLSEAAHYVQSLQITNSTIREVKSIINSGAYQLYGFLLDKCIVEASTIGDLFYCEACNITNNIIEGCSRLPINLRETQFSIRIVGNYFEANNGLSVKISTPENKVRNIVIESNYFHDDEYGIQLPENSGTNHGDIVIRSNYMGGLGTLIKQTEGVTYTDVVCLFNSGKISDGQGVKVISASDIIDLIR